MHERAMQQRQAVQALSNPEEKPDSHDEREIQAETAIKVLSGWRPDKGLVILLWFSRPRWHWCQSFISQRSFCEALWMRDLRPECYGRDVQIYRADACTSPDEPVGYIRLRSMEMVNVLGNKSSTMDLKKSETICGHYLLSFQYFKSKLITQKM